MRPFLADTIALLTFFTLAGTLNERYVAGLAWSEVLTSRLIGLPLMVLTARPYGLWRDWVLARLPGPRLLRDTAALLAFQLPIYAGIVLAAGADLAELLRGLTGFTLLLLASGRPYGLWLGWVRRRFGLPPDGPRPMSLGGP
ncbi:MAG: L-alanine exporter AlaE [Pseudomonadota bacterium]